MKGSALVIGSGISGMQAAAELVQQGIKVFLLEQRPTIGGTMSQIDKMYPTNECATCTQLPKMLELTSDPNVNLIAFADLKEVREADDGFKVQVEKKVRYVDPMKCNACTECFPVCPVDGIPMEFNLGRGTSKAISFWSPFPPRKALIDPEACTYIKEGKCGDGTEPLCVKACEPEAIDFSQKPEVVEFEVGAIVVATGAEEDRGELITRLGHQELPNVLTSLEYERLLSGLGPTGGTVKRDDGTVPKRLAWIVCQDFDGDERAASPVAFMTAASEALGTLERDAEVQVSVISGGVKTEGKGYEAFRADAEEHGVRFITASSVEVKEGTEGSIVVSCQGSEADQIEADMLVLTPPLVTATILPELADKLEIELDQDGYPKKAAGAPQALSATRDGVFLCGTVEGPKGISESVIQACAAAAGTSARLADVRGTETTPPPELKLIKVEASDEPKIAVVICRCGANIAGALDMQELADYVGSLPHVSTVEITPFGCDGVKVRELSGTGEYNRIVIGACSPRTHEPLFQMHTEAGGLNRYLMEIVNLRNHCTWVHMQDREGTTGKAKTLMHMGVVRAALQEPLEQLSFPVTQSCLVVSGTPAGIACAATLGRMGFETHLVISEDVPGAELENVAVYPKAQIGRVEGYLGNYTAEVVTAQGSKEVEVGAIVIATQEKMGQAGGDNDYEQDLYLSRDDENFFIGALGNLNPLDFNTDGVFMCGSAREHVDTEKSIISGEAAASRVAGIISHSEMVKSPVVSIIIDENCDGCAYCIEPCPANAITLIEFMKKGEIKKTVEVNEALCKGCGSCMATCPKDGVYVNHFKPQQIKAMVETVLEMG